MTVPLTEPNSIPYFIMASQEDIEKMLPRLDAFMRTLHHVCVDFNIEPKKEHIASCINYSDLLQMRKEFLHEMLSSVVRYVYSKSKTSHIVQAGIDEGREETDAWGALTIRAREKFKPSGIKGQFSELLLFNLLQFHFRAVPLLRKMKITTNPNLERNGADAIHIAHDGAKILLYLGEAKTYTSSFKAAFKNSIKSIVESHQSHRTELDLYKFEDFIEPSLERVAHDYINGKLVDAEVHLVCIVTYCSGDEPHGNDRDSKLAAFIDSIKNEAGKIKTTDYPTMENSVKGRINYIFVSINQLEELLIEFKTMLGI